MIPNMISDIPVISLLNSSEYEFYLTGSRYFGNYRLNSDWDFFTADDGDIHNFLVNNGFKWVPNENYKDASVVYYRECPVTNQEYHVQVVPNLAVKITAQEMLKPFLKLIPKQYHKELWEAAIEEASKK